MTKLWSWGASKLGARTGSSHCLCALLSSCFSCKWPPQCPQFPALYYGMRDPLVPGVRDKEIGQCPKYQKGESKGSPGGPRGYSYLSFTPQSHLSLSSGLDPETLPWLLQYGSIQRTQEGTPLPSPSSRADKTPLPRTRTSLGAKMQTWSKIALAWESRALGSSPDHASKSV